MQTNAQNSQVHFPEALRLRAPRGLTAALQAAARQRNTTAAEFARQALLRGIEAEGVRLRDGHVEALPKA